MKFDHTDHLVEEEKKFYIPVRWAVESTIIVEAFSLEEAIEEVKNNFSSYIPDNYEHDFDSVEINENSCQELLD